jgi:hypothetical protein
MIGRIEQCVDLGDGHSLVRLSHLHDFVARAHHAFPQDAEIEPRPSAGCQQRRHPRLVGPNADAIAGDAGLRDLEQGAADLKTIADANGIVRQSFNRKILAELSIDEVGSVQLFPPVAIGFDLIDEGGSLFAAVATQIGLAVSFQIQPADPAPAEHGIFPGCGAHNPAPPFDIARKSDVHGQ